MKTLRPGTKIYRDLEAFLAGQSYNRFEATRELHDWCLHSTVASLQRYGIQIARKDEVVPGYGGNPTHVTRYWLPPSEMDKARALLGKREAA